MKQTTTYREEPVCIDMTTDEAVAVLDSRVAECLAAENELRDVFDKLRDGMTAAGQLVNGYADSRSDFYPAHELIGDLLVARTNERHMAEWLRDCLTRSEPDYSDWRAHALTVAGKPAAGVNA